MLGLLAAAATRSPSFVEQFWPILAAGAFGVGGVLLGKRSERQQGRDAWRRDHRLTVYGDVLDSSHTFWGVAVRIYQRPDEQADRLDELNDAKLALHRFMARLALLGPDDVYEAAKAIGDVIEDIAELVTRTTFDNSVSLSRSALGERLTAADSAYLQRAQRQL